MNDGNKTILNISIITLIIVFLVYRSMKIDKLKDHYNTAIGTIYNYNKSFGSYFWILYGYFYDNGVQYKFSRELPCKELSGDLIQAKLMGIKVEVVYDPNSPTTNEMLLDERAYIKYNIPFPDSLRWMANFVNCR